MLIDIQAIRQAAKNKAAATGYTDNVDNVDNVAAKNYPNYPNYPRYPHYPVIHGLETPLKPPPDWTPPAPKPDPGLSRLMEAAMALCDTTGAGAKERADWCADVEAAMPEHRGDLLALVLRLMPKLMPPAVVSQAPTPAKAMPKFSVHQPWNEADREFQAHYWQCPACKAGGRTRGPLCPTGQHLHQLYEQAAMATKEST